MHWYKRDPDAALAGMAELTFEECGAYNRILDLLYSRDGNVPDDDVLVARMLGCQHRKWSRLKMQLIARGKIWSDGGKLTANRVVETISEANNFSSTQKERANKRWNKAKTGKENNDAPMPPGNASTSTTTTTATAREVRKKETRAVARSTIDEIQFLEFWAKYPNKTKKPLTRTALAAALKKASFEDIMAGLCRYIVEKPDYADWAMPTSWLNAERWTDQPKSGVGHATSGRGIIDAADRLQEKIAEFDRSTSGSGGDGKETSEGEIRSGKGQGIVRLVPKG